MIKVTCRASGAPTSSQPAARCENSSDLSCFVTLTIALTRATVFQNSVVFRFSLVRHSMNQRHLRIGITIGLSNPNETLWNNGIKQNAVFLAEALKNCPQVASVHLVNTTPVHITTGLPWDLERWPTFGFDAAKDSLDILIELGGQIDATQTDYLKQRGTRLVSYCCGFEYVHAMEAVLFDRALWGSNLFVNRRYDDIWMVPQVDNISRSYFETLRRAPARSVPFVWDPVFLEERVKDLPATGNYHPRGSAPRRLTVMEPNINVTKFCLYPILIAEEAYRVRPDAIGLLQVTNSERIAKQSMEFITLMNELDIVRDRKAIFLGRHDTPRFLAESTDVVVSHQLENPLNYFYLEVCWQGYPLVHNASLCPDLGYYYGGNDVRAACASLLAALAQHDDEYPAYQRRQRALIDRYSPHNPEVVETYARLLDQLGDLPRR